MNVFKKIILLPLALILFGILPARGLEPDPVVVNDEFNSREIGRQIEYLEDSGKKLTIVDIAGPTRSWKQSTADSINFGFTNSAYWFRFHIISSQSDSRGYYFEINYPRIDFIELYTPDADGRLTAIKAGDHYPFYQREIIDRNFIFKLEPNPGINTCYFRIETSSSMNFKPILWSPHAFSKRNNTEQPIMFIYYGFMIIMVIYNLFIFFWIRNSTYLFYSLFILSFTLFQAILNGYAYQYLWPGHIWWANNCLPFAMGLTLTSVTAFLKQHVNTSVHFPRVNWFYVYLLITPNLLAAIASLFTGYRIGITITTALAGHTAVSLYTAGIYIVYKRSRPGNFVLVGFTMLAFGVMAFVLKTFGFLPTNMITTWSIQLGSAMVLVILSLSLADEIYVAKNQLLDLNENLEKKVNERTKELKEVMNVLESINDNMLASNIELEEANTRYIKDMDMAASVQTAFLPKEPPVSNEYDIAFLFRPMSTVSGDFFDFYQADGRVEGVGIFDVSGHGISSGLMTLMARSTIEKNFTGLKHEKLGQVMDAINDDLIREMGTSGLYLTGILLRFTKNAFEYSNSGNPEMILRSGSTADTGIVRHNDSDRIVGPFLGIRILQENFISLSRPFNHGDCLLLYTDSLSETRNDHKEQFGEARIIESFKDAPVGTARDMLDHIMERFYSFTGKKEALNDDITVIIIKKR